MEGAIPLWVEGRLLWITGLVERTTCRDIIEWVIDCEHPGSTVDRTKYKIVERWKRMERHLPGKCKILRVWHAWGEERKNVRFLFRKRKRKIDVYSYDWRLYQSPELAMHRPKIGGCAGLRKIRVKKSFLDKDANKLRDIVVTQKQILSRQQQRLADKDEEIDHYETMIHLNRVEKVGENYLQETYLGKGDIHSEDEEKREDDDAIFSNSYDATQALQEATELYERILEISRRIEKQEENIRVLSAQIRYSISLKDPFSELVDDFSFLTGLKADDDKLDAYLYKTKIRIECLAALNKSQKLAIDHNERTLQEYNKIYEYKLSYMQQLENDLAQVDIETHSIKHYCVSSKYNFKAKKIERDGFVEANADVIFIDNNSDTGLSSLHSSSDEGYILDTLV